MTQADFAAAMGISRSTLSRYLSGEREPPVQFWRVAALVLGRDAHELLGSEAAWRMGISRATAGTADRAGTGKAARSAG